MNNKHKTILLSLLFLIIYSCGNNSDIKRNFKNQENTRKPEKEFISQTINILLDSLEAFDMSTLPRLEKFKDIKIEPFTIGLLDTVTKEYNEKFKLHQTDIIKFKSNYAIKLVKVNNYDSNILFIKFSNLTLGNNNASIVVKKNIGVAMLKEQFYFIKRNNIWVLEKKKFLGMG